MVEESDLLRWLEGECTREEAAAIQAWLSAYPARMDLLAELRAVWRHTGAGSRPWNIARARERLLRARGRPVPSAGPKVRHSAWSGWPRWSIAAGIIIALGASAAYLTSRGSTFRTYETEPGQRTTLSLPDGSRVQLSAASRLRVALPFGARERVVELQGEAYFVVQHDTRRPFVVRTQYGTARDLGTEFDVREYPQDTALQVIVASGQVELRGLGAAAPVARTLSASERGVVGADGNVVVMKDVELEHYLAWTEGRLVFDQAPLGDIVTELERWYDVEIETRDRALANERVTISFAAQTAEQAISELATVLNARHERTDRRVQLIRDPPSQ